MSKLINALLSTVFINCVLTLSDTEVFKME